jgi:hypothetical protein
MNWLAVIERRNRAAWLLGVAGCLVFAPALTAGERIIISRPKPEADPFSQPNPENDPAAKLLKNSLRRGSNPVEADESFYMQSTPQPAVSDHRASRLKQDEKRWWLMVGPGDLQPKDASKTLFEGQGSSLDDRNSLSRSGDYTFYGVGDEKTPAKSKKTDPAGPKRNSSKYDDDPSQPDSQRLQSGLGRNASDLGTQGQFTGLQDMFGQNGMFSDPDNTARNLMRGPGAFSLSPAPPLQRPDSLRQGGLGPLPGLSGMNDPINMGPDFTERTPNPVQPMTPPVAVGRSTEALQGVSAATPPFLSRGPGALGSASTLRPSASAPLPNAASAFLGPGEPRMSSPTVMGGSMFMREAPRRPGT